MDRIYFILIFCFRIGGFNGKAVVPYGGESSHRFQDKGKYFNHNSLLNVNKTLES